MADERSPGTPENVPRSGRAASSPGPDEEVMGRPVIWGLVVGVILAHLIGWIPVIGALLTGFATGFIARTRTRGLYASFVPAVFCMAWYWLITYLPDIPFWWGALLTTILAPMDFLLLGASALVFSLVLMGQFVFCVIGAWIGGWMQERRSAATHAGRATRA